jgi:hypothetical protein
MRTLRYAAFALSLSTLGCGAGIRSAARDVPREAVPVIADESLNVLEDPKTRERIATISATPEIHRAVREFAIAFVDGGIDAAASEDTSERLRYAFSRLVTELVPILDRSTRELSRSAARGIADEVQASLGPAMRASLVTELRSPELRAAMRDLAGEMSAAAIRGSRDALLELEKERAEGAPSPFATPLARVQRMVTYSVVGAFVLGAVAVTLLAWGLQLRARLRRYRVAIAHAAASDESGSTEHRDDVRHLLEELAR